MSDIPAQPGMPPLPEKEKNAIIHMAMPILGGTMIQGTDMLESMGHKLKIGNNTTICLEPDTREETDRLYNALSAGGSEGHRCRICSGVLIGEFASTITASAGCSFVIKSRSEEHNKFVHFKNR